MIHHTAPSFVGKGVRGTGSGCFQVTPFNSFSCTEYVHICTPYAHICMFIYVYPYALDRCKHAALYEPCVGVDSGCLDPSGLCKRRPIGFLIAHRVGRPITS